MPLKLLDYKLDGKSWEELCLSCYRMKYSNEHFHEIPAGYLGDGGIEGFTKNGIVIQCYCPEDPNLSHDDLYENQRNKITKDINKLIDLKNGELLKSIGVPQIKEWHFLVPEYKDRRILQHIEKKRKVVIDKKNGDSKYDYISEQFDVSIKVAADFRTEIYSLIRDQMTNIKLNLALREDKPINWGECDNEKINNVRRKVIAINPILEKNEDALNNLLDMYMSAYIQGVEMLKNIGNSFPDLRKDILDFANEYQHDIRTQTLLNDDHKLNSKLFKKIGDEFQEKISKQLKYLDQISIMQLKRNLIAGWLADCSMEFWGEYQNE